MRNTLIRERMRVLQIFSKYVEYGGEQRVVESVPKWLSGICEVETCLFDNQEWKHKGAPALWRQPFLMVKNPAALQRLRIAHQQFRPDVWLVSNVFPVASAAVYELAVELGVPIVHYMHNYRPFSVGGTLWADNRVVDDGLQRSFWPEIHAGAWQNSILKSACLAFAISTLHRKGWLRSVKAWVAISEFMQEKLVGAGVPASRIFAVRHPWVQRDSEPRQIRDDGYYLFLGRLHETKGVMVSIRAWQKVYEQLGEHGPKLWIAGSGPEELKVKHSALLNPLVKVCGLLSGETKRQAVQNCRAMLIPSVWWEPLGLVTYEAYEASKPVLAARSGGLVETIIEGKTGWLHEPGATSQLAEQVMDLERQPQCASEMGIAGSKWLSENAKLSDWRTQMMAVFQHAIDSRDQLT